MNCIRCNKETNNPKFCSASCSASHNNSQNHWRKKAGVFVGLLSCVNCETTFKYRHNKKYCCIKCQQTHQMNEAVKNKTASSVTLKRYLISVHGNKCFECGIEEWNSKPITMDLEHKDGNSENNDLSNLSLLCPNCHSQTPTYKAKNKGNGRHSRRERYKSGKSF